MARPKQIDRDLVAEIRKLYASGEYTQQELAVRFDLNQSTICKIINHYIHRYVNIIVSGKAEVRMGYKYGN